MEDDVMQQKIMSANISSYGYACETASSGNEPKKMTPTSTKIPAFSEDFIIDTNAAE
jgi:hypothetical protein